MKISPYNFLFALSKIRQSQHAFIENALAAAGVKDISPSYGDVLFVLDRRGPLTLLEIARLTMKDKSTVSSVIQKLEEHGYVTKKKGKGDSRFKTIELTAKARRLKPLILEISGEMNERLYRGMSESEKARLFKLIEKVFDNSAADAEPKDKT